MAAALPPAITTDHDLLFEYMKHQTGLPNTMTDSAFDLGALEDGGPVYVPAIKHAGIIFIYLGVCLFLQVSVSIVSHKFDITTLENEIL